MENIVDFAAAKSARTPHATGDAKCLDCKHKWVATAPVGVVRLDCPECGSTRGQFKYEHNCADGDSVFECNCGNSLFKRILRKSGRLHWLCIGCGVEPNV